MPDKNLPWENPDQNYKKTLIKRRGERRYRVLQLAKTLRFSLTRFKRLEIDDYNAEILEWIGQMEDGSAGDFDDVDFSDAKKFTNKIVKMLDKLELERSKK